MALRTKPEAQLAALLRMAVAVLEPGFGVRIWTGERIGSETGPILVIDDPAALARLLLRPTVDRAAELWTSGALDVEDGTLFDLAALRPSVRTREALKRLDKRALVRALPTVLRLAARHRARSASVAAGAGVSGSTTEAIRHHYDVSNDFYALFLDERMVYSCGYFDGWHDDLDQAQVAKLDMICRKLGLRPDERFLDIGCGWGALLIHAASHYGVTGHGVTLSQTQFDLATRRIREAGLQDRITIELKSFQELSGRFDKIASIGMFEHVGFAHHDAYFDAVRRLLRPRGLYLHHAIARPAKTTLRAFRRKSPEYAALTKHIFPGGELDFIGHSLQKLEAHRFEIHDVENWREHYGRTCRIWADRLHRRRDEAAAMVGEAKVRLWLLYLTGCALAFERGTVMIYQTVASRRGKGSGPWPATRRHLYADSTDKTDGSAEDGLLRRDELSIAGFA
ncbi:cyclopropane-fatty-acyl-phospholipid synthase family protein [Consotaella aegiceratis]|uniref:cyclopropane-fatty-acyl-phospholipid synthase family protein n=1 Tax=Consotaella aegiceratis TaxID=3097961 RepID=UPI002F3EC629